MTRADRGPILLIVGGILAVAAVVACLIESRERANGRRPAMATVSSPVVQTLTPYFSPHGGCSDALIDLIGSARRSVRVQAYSFTAAPIAEALIAAHRRGVDVAIVLDRGQHTSPVSAWHSCRKAGIAVTFDGKHAIAHNKVIVVDGKAVATGSYNFTESAESRNAENLLIVRDPATAAAYERNWTAHRDHSEPHPGPPR